MLRGRTFGYINGILEKIYSLDAWAVNGSGKKSHFVAGLFKGYFVLKNVLHLKNKMKE